MWIEDDEIDEALENKEISQQLKQVKVSEAKRPKTLEDENTRLKRLLATRQRESCWAPSLD